MIELLLTTYNGYPTVNVHVYLHIVVRLCSCNDDIYCKHLSLSVNFTMWLSLSLKKCIIIKPESIPALAINPV